ncbi:MAG TPA: alginate export family protein [bacterium]|nr:alginate export family protein [bacterium]
MRSRILKILIAVFAVALIAPAFSAVENVKVGGDIAVYGILRGDFDAWDTEKIHAFQTAARVYVSVDLTDNVSTMIRVINENVWGNVDWEYGNFEGILLDLAYIKVSDLLTPGLSLTVGRQEIQLGEGLVVGSRFRADMYPDVGHLAAVDLGLRKAFDAIRLDYAASAMPLNITAFMSKIDEEYDDTEDTDLYGLNLGFKLAEVANFDVYYVKEMIREDNMSLDTVGVRAVVGIPAVEGLSMKAEFAKQFGDYDDVVDFSGWALLAGFEYKMATAMEPTIKLNYARYSADDEDTDNEDEGWQLVFPSNTGSRIGPILYAYDTFKENEFDYVESGNAQFINLGISFKPAEKVKISIDAYWDRFIQPVAGTKDIGFEVDLGIEWAISEDLTFGICGGKLFGGDLFENADLADPWQIIASMKVAF